MCYDGYAFVLKGIWFKMIADGIKKEEYRDTTPYWLQRLFSEDRSDEGLTKGLYALNKQRAEMWCKDITKLKAAIASGKLKPHYKYGQFYLGYKKNRPQMEITIPSITIGLPHKGWCPKEAEDKECFVVELGKIDIFKYVRQ